MSTNRFVCRLDSCRVQIRTPSHDALLFASSEVPVEEAAISDLVSFCTLADTIREIPASFAPSPLFLGRVVVTPDFHKGSGIAVGTTFEAGGFVVPRCVGKDIGCGMALFVLDLTQEEWARIGARLDSLLRAIFFEGRRDLALSSLQRTAIFEDGLAGLLSIPRPETGLWTHWDKEAVEASLGRFHSGSIASGGTHELFAEFIAGSRGAFTHDDQLGSIGGGNHFVEIQEIAATPEGSTARAWGLKPGAMTLMIHSGSVGIGAQTGAVFDELARKAHPKSHPFPRHGFAILPLEGPCAPLAKSYLSTMRAAANFAAANRFFLGLMALSALSEAIGRCVHGTLLWDAPHNLAWDHGDGTILHRKGACPAEGPSDAFPWGHPVIVPGSMGADSFLLRSEGSSEALFSCCHGAGRTVGRQAGRKGTEAEIANLRVVSKLSPELARQRPDIARVAAESLMEEAPSCYKDVGPIIDTIAQAGIATPVARLRPLLTIKG
jgi:tRNA-splicing ligase RtcB